MLKALTAALALLTALAALPDLAAAQDRGDRRIAAIVNRDAITRYDLEQRVRLIGLGARVPDTGEAHQRLVGEVMRAMINERLQIQEAVKKGVEVTDKEVQDQVYEIERRNRLERGGLAKALRSRNIDPRTFEDQVRASLAWNKVITREIQPQIRVSDGEVDVVLKRLLANKDKLQYRLQEIFLPVESPAQQGRALATAQFILAQLRAGASFEILARQFSQTGTASNGGDMGFLFEGQMDPEIERAVTQLKTGQMAGPLRGAGGYYIVRVSDRRTITGRNPDVKVISVALAALRVPENATPAQLKTVQETFVKVAGAAKDCPSLVKAVQEAGGNGRIADDVVLEQQPPNVRSVIAGLKLHQASRPVMEPGAISIYMRCPDNPQGKPPDEKDVRESLMRQKLSAFAERYLKELRRSAYIDIRV